MQQPAQRRSRAWRVTEHQVLFDAPPWVRLERESVELPCGDVIGDFYRVRLPDFCVILATTSGGEFVMVRGYKHALGRSLLAAPAGMIEPGEDPLAAAQRELLEETGHRAAHWQKLGAYVTDGNRHCGTMHLFHARDAQRIQPPAEDAREPLICELLETTQLAQAMLDGQIANLPGLAAAAIGILLSNTPDRLAQVLSAGRTDRGQSGYNGRGCQDA